MRRKRLFTIPCVPEVSEKLQRRVSKNLCQRVKENPGYSKEWAQFISHPSSFKKWETLALAFLHKQFEEESVRGLPTAIWVARSVLRPFRRNKLR